MKLPIKLKKQQHMKYVFFAAGQLGVLINI